MKISKLLKFRELCLKYDSTSDMAERQTLGQEIDDTAEKMSEREIKDFIKGYEKASV